MTAGLRHPVAISVREPGQDPQATPVPNTLLSYFIVRQRLDVWLGCVVIVVVPLGVWG